jgi:hypothetical protein
MALYDQLPVYKTSYNLLIKLYQVVHELPKEHKFTLGEKLKNYCLDLVIGTYQANVALDKKSIIQSLLQLIEQIKILVRVSRDIRIIGLQQYVDMSVLIDSIAKQLRGWKRSIK